MNSMMDRIDRDFGSVIKERAESEGRDPEAMTYTEKQDILREWLIEIGAMEMEGEE